MAASLQLVVVAHIYPPVTGQRQTLTCWTIRTLFHYQDYFVIGEISTRLGVSDVPVDFFELLSTEFAACLKLPSRDNHRKASYPRTQQHDQGAG